MAHAQADISRLQEAFRRIGLATSCGQVIPRLWFAAILASIQSALVRSSEIVKDHDVDRGWTESSQLQVVGDHELIIWGMAPLKRKAVRRLAVLLLLLLWPREEEPTGKAVFSDSTELCKRECREASALLATKHPEQGLPRPSKILV